MKAYKMVVLAALLAAMMAVSGCAETYLAAHAITAVVDLSKEIKVARDKADADRLAEQNRENERLMSGKPPDVVVTGDRFPAAGGGCQVMDTQGRAWEINAAGDWKCVSWPAGKEPPATTTAKK